MHVGRRGSQLLLDLGDPPRSRRRKARRASASGRRSSVPHRSRPGHVERHPVHVTLRVRREVGFLRKERILRALVKRFQRSSGDTFQVVHYSVQTDHMHLIVEAASRDVLARKMTGLNTWIARRLNRLLGRTGAFFADRYHRRDLASPSEVRSALLYVLQNRKKHEKQRTGHVLGGIDVYSSGPWLDEGWAAEAARAASRARREAARILHLRRPAERPVPVARTWLACSGWLRCKRGPLGHLELPAT